MIIGLIRRCNICGAEEYTKPEENCPLCGHSYQESKPNKAPIGWVKLENYEISQRSVEKMLQNGELTKEDLK